VNDRFETLEVARRDVAHVRDATGDWARRGAEVAPPIEIQVETNDVVTRGSEERGEHGPDVAVVTCDENLHRNRFRA
jgi:hypothetical protein